MIELATPEEHHPDHGIPITSCRAGSDGDCSHPQCPQLWAGEPYKSGRNCPLWRPEDHEDY